MKIQDDRDYCKECGRLMENPDGGNFCVVHLDSEAISREEATKIWVKQIKKNIGQKVPTSDKIIKQELEKVDFIDGEIGEAQKRVEERCLEKLV